MSRVSGAPSRVETAVRIYLAAVGVLLLAVAAAKAVSAFDGARILDMADPVLWVSTRHLMLMACGLELTVCCYLVLGGSLMARLTLILWLGCLFVAYRLGLGWSGGDRACSCLGNATHWFPWLQAYERIVLNGILGFMVLGAGGLLCVLRDGGRVATGQIWARGKHSRTQEPR